MKNRYGDIYTFTEDDNHDILWEGSFEWCRFGMPNDYTRSYEAYCKYVSMVDSLKNEIDMVDPSGGPYISRDMPLDSFGFKGYVVKDFKRIDTGYKIITEKDEIHKNNYK